MAEIDLHDEVIQLKPSIKPILRDAMGVAYPIKPKNKVIVVKGYFSSNPQLNISINGLVKPDS